MANKFLKKSTICVEPNFYIFLKIFEFVTYVDFEINNSVSINIKKSVPIL